MHWYQELIKQISICTLITVKLPAPGTCEYTISGLLYSVGHTILVAKGDCCTVRSHTNTDEILIAE